jgi:FkbM family methyltransferase
VPTDLVIDVGAHDGSDTARYLADGYRVVAIEANPVLVRRLEERFAAEVADGRLEVVGAGVHENDGEASFYVSENDLLSSFLRDRATVGGVQAEEVTIPVLGFRGILEKYGSPHYLKVDIEGMDGVCLDALQPDRLPRFLSVELGWDAPAVLRRLQQLGYRRFKIISQSGHHAVTLNRLLTKRVKHSTPDHTSGPFGDAADGPWLSFRSAFAAAAVLTTRRAWQGGNLWHDLHATV